MERIRVGRVGMCVFLPNTLRIYLCSCFSQSHLSLVRSEFGGFFDDPPLSALRDGCGVVRVNLHIIILITGVTLWTLPVNKDSGRVKEGYVVQRPQADHNYRKFLL